MMQTSFGRYEIRQEVGRGGMATVYHAYDPRFKREVAIKVLPRELLHEQHFRARFEREAEIIASLEHSAIVPVYDYGEEDGQPFLVMRYMPGGSLADVIHAGALSVEDATRVLSQIAPAIDQAHAHGVIHRDLKPANIMFDAQGNAYLSDFGIAKLVESPSTLTGGGIVGTPAYMSPEQVHGEIEPGGSSDLYALGVILFQMLTGHLPYEASTPPKLMMMHVLDPVPSILAVRPDLPPDLEEIIACSMAKEPARRFPTAVAMVEALECVLQGEPVVVETRHSERAAAAAPTAIEERWLPREPATPLLSADDLGEPETVPIVPETVKEAVLRRPPAKPARRRGFNWRWAAAGIGAAVILAGALWLSGVFDGERAGAAPTAEPGSTDEPALTAEPSQPSQPTPTTTPALAPTGTATLSTESTLSARD